MNKSNFCFIAACIVFVHAFTVSCTSDIENDLSDLELSGNIEKVMNAEFEPVQRFGEVEIGAPTQFTVLTFNEHGLFSEREQYSEEGDLTFRIKHFHNDEETQHTHFNTYNNGTDADGKTEYTYNDIGKVSTMDIFKADGEFSNKHVFEYDEQGEITKENLYHDDGSLYLRWIYTNDEADNSLTITAYDSDGESMVTSVYSYNDRNELISKNEEEHKHVERDQNDNWTKKVVSEDGNPTKIIHRSIEYRNGTVTGEYDLINNIID